MRKTSFIIAATLALTMPTFGTNPFNTVPSSSHHMDSIGYALRARHNRRRQNQSPMAQKARAIRKRKSKHAKKYNRHFTPRMK